MLLLGHRGGQEGGPGARGQPYQSGAPGHLGRIIRAGLWGMLRQQGKDLKMKLKKYFQV